MKTALKASIFSIVLALGLAIGSWSLIAFTAGPANPTEQSFLQFVYLDTMLIRHFGQDHPMFPPKFKICPYLRCRSYAWIGHKPGGTLYARNRVKIDTTRPVSLYRSLPGRK